MRRIVLLLIVLLCLTGTAFAQSSLSEMLADPDGIFVEINGVQLYYVERGDPGGEPILLLHGFAGSAADFFTMMPPLEDMGYRVIAFDRPPFGLADKSPDIDYSAASQAAWTVGLMDHLGIGRATLLGHSAGGSLAAGVALTYPDRVTRLILVGASIDTWQGGGEANPGTDVIAFTIGQAFNFNDDAARAQLRDYFTEERLIAFLQANYFEPIELTPEIIQYSTRWTQIPDWEAGLLAFARTFVTDTTAVSPEMTADLTQPTLIVWGRDDRLVPLRVGERLAETIVNNEFAVFDEAGHLVWDDAPEAFTSAVLQFLHLDDPDTMMAQIAAEWAGDAEGLRRFDQEVQQRRMAHQTVDLIHRDDARLLVDETVTADGGQDLRVRQRL
jgi:pimeloyl-ACP methyl ester carboxylesterase